MKQLQRRLALALNAGRSKQSICKKAGLDHRELSRILNNDKNNVLALHKSDLLLMAIGEGLGELAHQGLVNVVPLGSHKKNVKAMAEDTLWVQGIAVTPEAVDAKIEVLLAEKKDILIRLAAEDEEALLALSA